MASHYMAFQYMASHYLNLPKVPLFLANHNQLPLIHTLTTPIPPVHTIHYKSMPHGPPDLEDPYSNRVCLLSPGINDPRQYRSTVPHPALHICLTSAWHLPGISLACLTSSAESTSLYRTTYRLASEWPPLKPQNHLAHRLEAVELVWSRRRVPINKMHQAQRVKWDEH